MITHKLAQGRLVKLVQHVAELFDVVTAVRKR
jgi:hypothetical protein